MIRNSILLLCVFSVFLVQGSFSQNSQTEEHAYMMVQSIQKFHYFPKEVNDTYSESVFDRFIEITDPFGVIFTKSDLQDLAKYKHSIDDDILKKESSFLNDISTKYNERLTEIRSWYVNSTDIDLDFPENDSITFSNNSPELSKDEQDLFRMKILKFKVLTECMLSNDSVLNVEDFSAQKRNEAKQNIIKNEICRLESKISDPESFEKYVHSAYLHSVAYAFDPHTDYFSGEDMDMFESMLSKESSTFGISLAVDENYRIIIDKLIPGGPAWDSELLNEEDIILKVEAENGQQKNFECIKLIDAIIYLASEELNKATFHIRKKNGKELKVVLEKEVLSVEENIINSFILKGQDDIGYIRLSTFYADFDYSSTGGCAEDLAKEIIRLKRQGIKGLILDLRDNGGGALGEAVKAAGLFIDFGAVGILDTRYDDITVLKDSDRGILFNEPLVLLMNSASASASEFLAAALQDHNRAVIAGSRSFGKSTSQIILPIDAYNYFNGFAVDDPDAEAYIKLTTGVFFRVTGKSHQKEGVLPDVELSENGYSYNESDLSTSMDNISTEKKAWFKPFNELPLKMLNERSKARFKTESSFNPSIKSFRNEEKLTIPLGIHTFQEFANSFFFEGSEKGEETAPYEVSSFDFTRSTYTDENSSNEIINDASENISKDRYIFEAYYIMNDLIDYYK